MREITLYPGESITLADGTRVVAAIPCSQPELEASLPAAGHLTLGQLYRSLTKNEKVLLAEVAGIKPAFLWQVATRWKGKRPSLQVIHRLANADSRLSLDALMFEFSDAASGVDLAAPAQEQPHA